MSKEIAKAREHPNKYKNNFDAVVTYHLEYIDKQGQTPSVKVASIVQTRSTKRQKTSTVLPPSIVLC